MRYILCAFVAFILGLTAQRAATRIDIALSPPPITLDESVLHVFCVDSREEKFRPIAVVGDKLPGAVLTTIWYDEAMTMPKMPEFPSLPPGLGEAMVLMGHRTAGYGHGYGCAPEFETIYDKLAKRLYVSKEFVKRTTLLMGYSGNVDPWLAHLVNTEIDAIMQETP